MKLLIITQSVDINNPALGFFHRWIKEFAKHFESIVVICLEKGEYHLPENVKVLSLGKENSKLITRNSKLFQKSKYFLNFWKYIWRERNNYDSVFVHMNQEYIILGWKIWWLLGKKIYMWRNHYAGNFLTDLAAFFCTKVFCTSKYSYTAKYKKTVLMPVGIDTGLFKPDPSAKKISRSILSLGRIAPSKNIHILIDALGELKKKGVDFVVSIYGEAKPEHKKYLEHLNDKVKTYGLENQIKFYGAVSNRETPKIYNQHEIFVNLSPIGMLDKTIFEAICCGTFAVVATSAIESYSSNLCFQSDDPSQCAVVIQSLFQMSHDERCVLMKKNMEDVLNKESLAQLMSSFTLQIS